MSLVSSKLVQMDVSDHVPLGGAHSVAVEIFWPSEFSTKQPPEQVLFCKPGGAMNRHYFSLVAEQDYTHSFAHYMVARNRIVVSVDHLGVGESSIPADGYELTLEVLTAANHAAVHQTLKALANGEISEELPALADLSSIGVGHSMGAMLTVVQQHRHSSYEGLILLGFCNRGIPDILNDEQKAYIDDSESVRRDAVSLTRQYFPEPYVHNTRDRGAVSGKPNKSSVSDIAKQAVAKTEAPLLAVGGMMSLIPGSIGPEMKNIQVPVFLGIGDRDLIESPHTVPAEFPACKDISLMVLPQTGHNHFLYPNCESFFARMHGWLNSH